MARIDDYRNYIQQVLRKYAAYKPAIGDVEIETIVDLVGDHYQLVSVGWHNLNHVYGCILHIDIKGDKIWIQHDGTEAGIANELVELGVPKEQIVLGYHPPYKRPYTGFAVN